MTLTEYTKSVRTLVDHAEQLEAASIRLEGMQRLYIHWDKEVQRFKLTFGRPLSTKGTHDQLPILELPETVCDQIDIEEILSEMVDDINEALTAATLKCAATLRELIDTKIKPEIRIAGTPAWEGKDA